MDDELLDFLLGLSRDAGALAMDYRARIRQIDISMKSAKDLVTEADCAVESFVVNAIRARFPTHAILGEESGTHEGEEYRWVIDPIDGTASFVHEQPYFSVSIALEHNGETIFGAVNAPVLGELYWAGKGQGAFCNGTPIQVSARATLEEAIFATGFACIREGLAHNNLRYFNALMPQIRDVRRYGSAAVDLCYVACGRLEGFWELNLKPYDVAAGLLIVEEAGGQQSDFSGGTDKRYREVAATNGLLHDPLLAVLQSAV